jgi:hypothetical protein
MRMGISALGANCSKDAVGAMRFSTTYAMSTSFDTGVMRGVGRHG